MSILSGNNKRKPALPATVQEAAETLAPRPVPLPPRHPLAERAAEAAQYVIDVEAERDHLKQQLAEARNEIHFLKMNLEAAEKEGAKLRDARDYLVGLVSAVKSRADLIAKNLLDLMGDITKTSVDSVPPVSEYAPRPAVDVDMNKLADQIVAESASDKDPGLPEFLGEKR